MFIKIRIGATVGAAKFGQAAGLAACCWFAFASVLGSSALAQDSLEDLAKKAQDPLADITAIMTDNTIGFNQGPGDDTGYGFQLQPVKSFDTPYGFRLIPRAIIPIVGAPNGGDFVFLGDLGGPAAAVPTSTSTTWGLSDTMVQMFVAPETDSSWKFGIGPQVSLSTHTDSRLKGPGWGAGVAAVAFGGIGNLALGGIVGQHWGNDGNFSTLAIQPIALYNFEKLPGVYLGYNNTISADWKQSGKNVWTVPLGLTVGKILAVGNGAALDLSIGGYNVVARPDGAADWQLKFGVSLLR